MNFKILDKLHSIRKFSTSSSYSYKIILYTINHHQQPQTRNNPATTKKPIFGSPAWGRAPNILVLRAKSPRSRWHKRTGYRRALESILPIARILYCALVARASIFPPFALARFDRARLDVVAGVRRALTRAAISHARDIARWGKRTNE